MSMSSLLKQLRADAERMYAFSGLMLNECMRSRMNRPM